MFQHAAQIVTQHLFRQIDEMNDVVHLRHVEEGELLLIAQHLERRLSQHREVHGGPLCRRVGEHELVGERGLSRPHFAENDVERILRPAAAKDVVQLGDARRE